MNIKIKQISSNSSIKDIDNFIYTYLKLFNDKENLIYLSFTNIPFTKEMVENWMHESKQSGVEYYVAQEENGNYIGIMPVRFNTIEAFEIISMVVDKSYRNKGVGSLFLKTALDKAKEKGFKSVKVDVFADNKNMLSLLIKNDFKLMGIEYNKRFDGEDLVHLKNYLT